MMDLLAHWHYVLVIALMMMGLYIVIVHPNLTKKMMGLNLFQVSVIMLYVAMGKIKGGTAPILIEDAPDTVYTNPIPHVLMLTAIVVGVATTAVGLSLIIRIRDAYGTQEEDELHALDRKTP